MILGATLIQVNGVNVIVGHNCWPPSRLLAWKIHPQHRLSYESTCNQVQNSSSILARVLQGQYLVLIHRYSIHTLTATTGTVKLASRGHPWSETGGNRTLQELGPQKSLRFLVSTRVASDPHVGIFSFLFAMKFCRALF